MLEKKNLTSNNHGEKEPHKGIFSETLLETLVNVNDYKKDMIHKLYDILEGNTHIQLRGLQKEGVQATIDMLKAGGHEGYIKIPTGVGKTFLFVSQVLALQQATLIMVPTKDLVSQTAAVFRNDFDCKNVYEINPTTDDRSIDQLNSILEKIDQNFDGIIISTNQSLKSIYTKNVHALRQLTDIVNVYITDEGHKAMGERQLEMMDTIMEDIIGEKLHILFTATPIISHKKLSNYYTELLDVKLERAFEADNLVLPTPHFTSPAILDRDLLHSLQEYSDIMDMSAFAFVNERGQFVFEEITNKYLELKNTMPGTYLPGIAVCRNIAHAEFITQYLNKRGVRAVRVTSENHRYYSFLEGTKAKKLINNDEIDVAVTVSKIAEGWDVPTLRVLLKYSYTKSPAKDLQTTGRIMRHVEIRHLEQIKIKGMSEVDDARYVSALLKNKDNTFLIEPEYWEAYSFFSGTEKKSDEDNVLSLEKDYSKSLEKDYSNADRGSEGKKDVGEIGGVILNDFDKSANSKGFLRIGNSLINLVLSGEVSKNSMEELTSYELPEEEISQYIRIKMTAEKIIKKMREDFPTVEDFDIFKLTGANSWRTYSVLGLGLRKIGSILGINGTRLHTSAGKNKIRRLLYPEADEFTEDMKKIIISLIQRDFPAVDDFDDLPLTGDESWRTYNVKGMYVYKLGKLLNIQGVDMQSGLGKKSVRDIVYSNEPSKREIMIGLMLEDFPKVEDFDSLPPRGEGSWSTYHTKQGSGIRNICTTLGVISGHPRSRAARKEVRSILYPGM